MRSGTKALGYPIEFTQYLEGIHVHNLLQALHVGSPLGSEDWMKEKLCQAQRRRRSDGECDRERVGLYAAYVPAYLDFVRAHRGRRTTHQIEDCLGRFFTWMAGRGIHAVTDLHAAHVREFMTTFASMRQSTIATHASALRGLLKHLFMEGGLTVPLANCVEVPRLYRMSQPPLVLDQDRVTHLLASVDRSKALGKRDYAMLLLAARYGLRPSDIRGLRFEDIRWREQRVVLMQSKTQRLLELPLMGDVDAALVDYIRGGRPQCAAREIFIRHVAPIGPFATRNNLWPVMGRAMRAADIELPGRGKGLYLLRHSIATQMLGRDVPLDTISDILGHASVDTTRVYAQVDISGLRSVAMSESEVGA